MPAADDDYAVAQVKSLLDHPDKHIESTIMDKNDEPQQPAAENDSTARSFVNDLFSRVDSNKPL